MHCWRFVYNAIALALDLEKLTSCDDIGSNQNIETGGSPKCMHMTQVQALVAGSSIRQGIQSAGNTAVRKGRVDAATPRWWGSQLSTSPGCKVSSFFISPSGRDILMHCIVDYF